MEALPFSFHSIARQVSGCQQRTGARQSRLEPNCEIKKTNGKRKPGLEHFSHLPLEQPVGCGRGFCYRGYFGLRPGLHQVSHGNAEKAGYQRRFYYRRLKSCCIYLLPKRIVNALEVSGAGSGATSCNPGRPKEVLDGLSANYRYASR